MLVFSSPPSSDSISSSQSSSNNRLSSRTELMRPFIFNFKEDSITRFICGENFSKLGIPSSNITSAEGGISPVSILYNVAPREYISLCVPILLLSLLVSSNGAYPGV